jgi:putative ABC transport system permease protein
MNIFRVFAGIAIFISCLGIWGLASFDTVSRTKEISIRKVLGATVTNIIKMLSGQFLRLVLISCLIALPFSHYGITRFLDQFAYKVKVDWWFYTLPTMSLVLITMLTISMLTIRAALTNPADNLRSE